MRQTTVLAFGLAAALTACSRGPGGLLGHGGLGFNQFVDATVALRQLARTTTNPAEFAARKRALEARLGVTDAALQDFVRVHADDVKLLSAVWDSVDARLGRAGRPDAATRPTPQPGATGPTPVPTPTTGQPPARAPRPGPPRF